MNTLLNSALTLTYNQLSTFSGLNNFWQVFDTAFGTQYNRSGAEILRLQWLSGDFSQVPQIEILDSSILGGANGAYASSNNKIYLSANFLATATAEAISAVLLEEIGHFVDAHINLSDSAGDEGAIFAELVQGYSLDTQTLQALKAEDDHGTITVNGQVIQVEQQNFTGTNGNNTITGTSSNDTINSRLGNDTVDGGAGTDLLIVDYSSVNTGINGSLQSSISSSTGGFNGSFYTDYAGYHQVNFSNIEQFQITGTAASDTISTGGGNDTINGGAGDDYINAGLGNDTVDGGDGVDTLGKDFSSSTSNLTFDTTGTTLIIPTGISFSNIEAFDITVGSGNDTIKLKGIYNDTINGGIGNDTINSGLGNDTVDGGAGTDLLIVDYSSVNTGINGSLQSSISSSTGGFNGSFYTDYAGYHQVNFSNIEQFQITGTAASDTISTGGGNDTINGGAGNDIINAGGGNDTINGVNETLLKPGLGEIDVLTGGTGSDRFILGNATKAYYDDGNTLTNGSNDYADITDFNTGDIIQLQGTSSNYLLAVVGADTQILINKPGTEPDELIGIIRNKTGLSLTGSSFAYVVLPTITLAVSPSSVLEDGTTNLVYTFTRTGITTNALTVNYGITGTADSTDYTGATPGTGKTITFAANSATATLTIDPTADTTIEANETVALTLATGTGYLIGTTTAVTGTITNDDTSITLAVSPSSVLEDGTTNLVYTFTRTGITTNALTVNYGITGTADSTDYTGATPGTGKTITFAANSATATLTIDPTADTTIEANETVALTLATGTGYLIGTTTAVTGTITNDDTSITLAVSPSSVLEDGTTNLVYTFTRTGITTNALTVNYGITGTADSTDYTGATPGTGKTITFAAGASTATLTIDPTVDTTIESDETVALTLATGTGYLIGTTTDVTGTITNDDTTITLAVSPTSVLEDGTTNLVYTFTRTGITTNALTVNYGITGTADSTDYTGATPGTGKTITFAAGASTATLTIDPTVDTTIESDETVALTLATGTGYLIGTTTDVTGTITNDDTTITLAVSPTSVLEDGTTNLVYTFTRTGITTNALTVNYGITGTADSTDYIGATPGTDKTITFAANSATATLTIDPTADTIVESDETVALTLATGTGYLIGTTTDVTGTITNDDTTITLAVSPTSVLEDGTTNLVYTFTRTGITTNALTVNYGITGTADSTDYTGATPGTGKTITFAANSATATLTIDPTADTILEANETVDLTLVAGTGYTLGTTTAVTGTITNDDLLPSINLSTNRTIVEGLTSPQNVTYTVTLTSASSQSITVQYATANGTAIAASDYTSTSGTLTFNPGVTSQVINIPILNNSLSEANEAFTLTLSSPTNANLGTTNTVTTTITDTLSASVTTTLPANVENLTLTGTTAINGTGNVGNNILQGNSANNTLTGLNGNDTYSFVANSALGIDTITETTTDGIDTITFNGTTVAVNVNLGVTTSQTVNSKLKLILSANNVIENATGGTGNDRLTGNTLNNILSSGDGNDQLQGLGGDDNLWGGAGNDILNGGIGNDSLWGGLGDDVLTGGVGNDQYLFQSDSVFSTSLGVDYISDFEAGLDQIVLSKTTFNAITDTVGQALTDFAVVSDDEFVNASNARIVFSQGTGSLFYNQDGNLLGATAVFEFARLGNVDITLSSSNFSLIA